MFKYNLFFIIYDYNSIFELIIKNNNFKKKIRKNAYKKLILYAKRYRNDNKNLLNRLRKFITKNINFKNL